MCWRTRVGDRVYGGSGGCLERWTGDWVVRLGDAMKRWLLCLATLGLTVVGYSEWAIFPRDFPAGRVVENAEKNLRANSKDTQVQYVYARVHSYMYAFPGSDMSVIKDMSPFFRTSEFEDLKYERNWTSRNSNTLDHLRESLIHYRIAKTLDPTNYLARLGYAWMLEEAATSSSGLGKVFGITDIDRWPEWWLDFALNEYRALHSAAKEDDASI